MRASWPSFPISFVPALVAGVIGSAVHPHSTWPQSEPQRPVEPLPERLAGDVAFLDAVLSDVSAGSALRRAAAERLARDGSPEASRALERALGAGGTPRALSIEALDRATAVPAALTAALAEAAIALAVEGDRDGSLAATRALARSGEGAAAAVARIAFDMAESRARRIGAIGVLGELRDRTAAEFLLKLLDESRAEASDLMAVACTALDRCAGLAIGNDPVAWRRWGSESADASKIDDAQIRAMSERAADAERALATERGRGQQLEARVVEAYQQLFLRLTQSERLVRSADLLDDELLALRTFGIAQIERMLRNGERADDATRRQALVLLDDVVPALRVRGARLLDDLGVTDLPMRLAERLPKEKDPLVAAAYLSVLANRPEPATFPTLLALVKDPALGEYACRVIAILAAQRRLPLEWESQVLTPLRDVVAARPNAAAAQLLAMAGDEVDLARVSMLLDGPDASVRRGAAEGLRRRGVRRPLLERSSDPAIYGPVVAALADEPKTLDTVRALVAVPPPPDMTPDWNASAARLLRELPATDLVAADKLLAGVTGCERRTRAEGLARIVGGARAGIVKADVEEGLTRFVDLLIADGRGQDAIATLEESAPKPGDPTFDALFRAQALTGNFREAARLVPLPRRWIELLTAVVREPSAARPLADEISLRFGASLSADERAAFDKSRRELPASPATVTVPTEPVR
ncbi:MAG: hypothetical protein SGJ09_09925 [Phycisphaerae bacterium]|nr:hypothetical protein [Phycisphaerae bacterium]